MAPAAEPGRRVVRDVPIAATVCLVGIGILFTVLAIIYFAEPAHDLPGLIPGSDPDVKRHHVKHGIAALLAGIAAILAAVFSAGGRDTRIPSARAAAEAENAAAARAAAEAQQAQSPAAPAENRPV